MTLRTDWIPAQIKAFKDRQGTYFAKVVANKVAWGIPDAAIAPLLVLQTEFLGLYDQIKEKKDRTSAKLGLFHDCMKRYAKAWRLFHKEWVAFNSAISKDDMIILVGKEYSPEPSPHPEITDVPFVKLAATSGGDIEVRVRVTEDKTMTSMHPDANLVEVRFVILEPGDIPPADENDFTKKEVSSRAKFTLALGLKNTGKKFWGIFRWVNVRKPRTQGHWTGPISVVIA